MQSNLKSIQPIKTDAEIEAMDSHALEFWKQWKEPLLAMCKAHAVKPGEEK